MLDYCAFVGIFKGGRAANIWHLLPLPCAGGDALLWLELARLRHRVSTSAAGATVHLCIYQTSIYNGKILKIDRHIAGQRPRCFNWAARRFLLLRILGCAACAGAFEASMPTSDIIVWSACLLSRRLQCLITREHDTSRRVRSTRQIARWTRNIQNK